MSMRGVNHSEESSHSIGKGLRWSRRAIVVISEVSARVDKGSIYEDRLIFIQWDAYPSENDRKGGCVSLQNNLLISERKRRVNE